MKRARPKDGAIKLRRWPLTSQWYRIFNSPMYTNSVSPIALLSKIEFANAPMISPCRRRIRPPLDRTSDKFLCKLLWHLQRRFSVENTRYYISILEIHPLFRDMWWLGNARDIITFFNFNQIPIYHRAKELLDKSFSKTAIDEIAIINLRWNK